MNRTLILTASLLLGASTLTALLLRDHASEVASDGSENASRTTTGALATRVSGEDGGTRTTVPADESCTYHLTRGTQLRFKWTSRTETTIGAIEGGAPDAGPVFALTGDLLVTGLGTRGDDLLVELRFATVRVDTLGADATAATRAASTLSKDLQSGALVRLARDGRILGYGFADGLQLESNNWLRTIASACRVRLGAAADPAWTCEETDETGTALCEQRWTGPLEGQRRGWSRKKVRYLDSTEKAPRPKLDSSAEGTFDLALGWPSRAAGRQRAQLEVPNVGLRVDSRFTFACELEEVVAAAEALCPDRATDAALSGAADCAGARANASAAEYRAKLEHVTTDELVRSLLELARGDLASTELLAARENLVWALKLWPERVADVLRAIKLGSLEDQGLMVLLSALGAAQHETAQKALVECCSESEGEKTRVLALRALFQVEKATKDTVEAARVAARGTGSELVASTALLLLGRFADGDGKQTQALLAQESEAVSGARVGSWLLALGNSHSPDALAAVQRHMISDDPGIRTAAVDALGSLPGPAALDALAQRTVSEAEPSVRAHAAETLAMREEPASLRLVDELLVREQDPDVRTAALRPLARRLPDSEARRLLERSASTDPDPRVRTFAVESLKR